MSEPRDVLIRHAGRRCVHGGAVSIGRAGRGRTECRHWSEGGRWIRAVSKAFNRKMRILLSDGHGQQLHVVGAVAGVTISARLGHRESICTSSAMCGRAAESVSAAAGSLAAVAAHLLL